MTKLAIIVLVEARQAKTQIINAATISPTSEATQRQAPHHECPCYLQNDANRHITDRGESKPLYGTE